MLLQESISSAVVAPADSLRRFPKIKPINMSEFSLTKRMATVYIETNGTTRAHPCHTCLNAAHPFNGKKIVANTTFKTAETDVEVERELTDVLHACSETKETSDQTKPRRVHDQQSL